MKKTEDQEDNVIEITEEIQIPGSDIILETGDLIRVLAEEISVDVVFAETDATLDEKGLWVEYYGESNKELRLLKKNENDIILEDVLYALKRKGADLDTIDFENWSSIEYGLFFPRK